MRSARIDARVRRPTVALLALVFLGLATGCTSSGPRPTVSQEQPTRSGVERDSDSGAQTATAEYGSIRIQLALSQPSYTPTQPLSARIMLSNLSAQPFHGDRTTLLEVRDARTNEFLMGSVVAQFSETPPPLSLAANESTSVVLTIPSGWDRGAQMQSTSWPVRAKVVGMFSSMRTPGITVRLDR